MAYYAYKRVCLKPEFIEAEKKFKETNPDYEADPNYDGDCWLVAEELIDSLLKKIKDHERTIDAMER